MVLLQYLDYWEEIRWRGACCLAFFALCFLVALVFSDKLYAGMAFVVRRYQSIPVPWVVLSVWDAFSATISLACYTSSLVSFPCFIWHLSAFLRPALYPYERSKLMGVVGMSMLLFYLGVVLAWVYILPMALWSASFWMPSYAIWMMDLSSVVSLLWLSGLLGGSIMQFPVVLFLGLWFGFWDVKRLVCFRPYFWLGSFVVGMFLTPPDMFLQCLVAMPLCVFYEMVVLFCWLSEKKMVRLLNVSLYLPVAKKRG